jgi:hypothetical protein
MTNEPVRLEPIRIGQTLDDLAVIGNRYAGSAGEAACRDYVIDRMRSLDLADVRLEPFPYLGFVPGEASCSISGGGGLVFESHPLQYTRAATVAGEAVYIGEATPADFERLDRARIDLRDKVVIAHTMFPFDLADELAAREIVGFVHICETPFGIVGNFAGALYRPPLEPPWPGRPTPFTGVTIGLSDGRALVSEMTARGALEVALEHDGIYETRTADNVIGEIYGDPTGPEQLIVCAHYDSQAEGQCIFDNGGGVASLLELARTLGRSEPQRRIVLLASAAEEVGVWGATAYVHAHAEEMDGVAAMINLDGVASSYPSHREIWSAHEGIASRAVQTARHMDWVPDRVMNTRSTFGDHAPFGDAGVPSCLIWRPDFPYYHSKGDVRELVDERAVAETASVSATLARDIADGLTVREETAEPR